MIRFGPAGICINAKDYEDSFDICKKNGLKALEVEFVHGANMKEARAREVGKLAKKNGISLSCHAPFYVNLNSNVTDAKGKPTGVPDKKKILRSQKHILSTLKRAHWLEAKVIAVHAGFYMKMSSKKATRNVINAVKWVRKEADNEGFGDVWIGLETMGKASSWGLLEEIKMVCDNVERVCPVVDFGHMHAFRQNLAFKDVRQENFGSPEAFETLLAEFEEFADGLDAPFLHSHFSCIEYGPRGEKKHLPLSAKDPDFAHLAPVLRKRKYPITVICESPLLDQDAARMVKIMDNLKKK